MALMPPQDALFLLAETRERPMHVGGLQLFTPPEDAGPDFVSDLFHRALDRLDDNAVRRTLRRRPDRLIPGIGPWRWILEEDLDLEYHVRHSALPHPGRIRELLALVSRLHGSLLARSRPLWEAHLVEGLADGRFALYTKIHHALMDGVSAMKLMENSFSPDPDATDMPPPWAARDRGSRSSSGGSATLPSKLVDGTVMAARAVSGAGQAAMRAISRAVVDQAEMLPYRAPRSMLNVPITGARRFAADKWELERLRRVSEATDATLNDVLMAMCAGALRGYLEQQQALPDDPLVSMVPVALERKGDSSNAVGLILCTLGTHLADPEERFDTVVDSMERGKLRLEGLTPEAVLLLSGMSFAPLGLGPLFRWEPMRRPPFNIVISNVPGPREHLYYNGARIDGSYPMSIPFDGQAMNITATSYAGSMCFGLTGCRRSVPQLQRLLDHLEGSLTELEEMAGVA